MKPSKSVNPSCVEADARYKGIASEYKDSALLLQKRINKTKGSISRLKPESLRRDYLELQLQMLSQMYRTTCEIGREAEHYYEKGWWRSEVYTVNTR